MQTSCKNTKYLRQHLQGHLLTTFTRTEWLQMAYTVRYVNH